MLTITGPDNAGKEYPYSEEMEQQNPQPAFHPQAARAPPGDQAGPSNAQARVGRPMPMTLDYMYDEMVRHNAEMMQRMQQMQRDQHDYANWTDQGMWDLSNQMHDLSVRVDDLHEIFYHVGVGNNQPPHQGARGRGRRGRARGRGNEE